MALRHRSFITSFCVLYSEIQHVFKRFPLLPVKPNPAVYRLLVNTYHDVLIFERYFYLTVLMESREKRNNALYFHVVSFQ